MAFEHLLDAGLGQPRELRVADGVDGRRPRLAADEPPFRRPSRPHRARRASSRRRSIRRGHAKAAAHDDEQAVAGLALADDVFAAVKRHEFEWPHSSDQRGVQVPERLAHVQRRPQSVAAQSRPERLGRATAGPGSVGESIEALTGQRRRAARAPCALSVAAAAAAETGPPLPTGVRPREAQRRARIPWRRGPIRRPRPSITIHGCRTAFLSISPPHRPGARPRTCPSRDPERIVGKSAEHLGRAQRGPRSPAAG